MKEKSGHTHFTTNIQHEGEIRAYTFHVTPRTHVDRLFTIVLQQYCIALQSVMTFSLMYLYLTTTIRFIM